MSTFAIKTVDIEITYPDDTTEMFSLKRPYTFEFRFKKIAKLPDYKDAFKRWQPGCYFYQFMATYEYEHHDMDLRKLLVAKKIVLKFPPVFDDTADYQSAEVLLANDEVPKNYLQGLALAENGSESVPSGSVTLEFEGTEPINESELRLNYLFGTGGGFFPSVTAAAPSIEYNNLVAIWAEIHETEFQETHYYMTKEVGGAWSADSRGPDNGPGVAYQVPMKGHRSADGDFHLIYADSSYNIWYRSFNGSTWSGRTKINTWSSGAFKNVVIEDYNGEVYVYYSKDDAVYLWKKSTGTSTEIPITGSEGVYLLGNSADRPFIISSAGVMYAALQYGSSLVILESSDLGETWSEHFFRDFSPYNNTLFIQGPINMAFQEDPDGIIHLTAILYNSGTDEYEIIKIDNTNWYEATAVDLIHDYETFGGNNPGKNYLIDPYGVHHIILRVDQDDREPILIGYTTDDVEDFESASPLNNWSYTDLLEPTGYSRTPSTSATRTVVVGSPPVGDYLNIAYNVDNFDPYGGNEIWQTAVKAGYMEWDVPSSYDNVLVECEGTFNDFDEEIYMMINASGSSWETFSGYLVSVKDGLDAFVVVRKKVAGSKSFPQIVGYMSLGSVIGSPQYNSVKLSVSVEKAGSANKISVTAEFSNGLEGTRTWIDDDPINHVNNKYGLFHIGADLDEDIYTFRVADLDTAEYSTVTADDPGIYHIHGNIGAFRVDRIQTLPANQPPQNELYAILDGDTILMTYMNDHEVMLGTYENGSWSFSAIQSANLGSGAGGNTALIGKYGGGS